jgi:hypothetical protein
MTKKRQGTYIDGKYVSGTVKKPAESNKDWDFAPSKKADMPPSFKSSFDAKHGLKYASKKQTN